MADPSWRNATDPAEAVLLGTKRVLELATTWLSWDGTPKVSEHGDRIYTPQKAIRRHADHLIDHLAHIEALLDDTQPLQDQWRGSLVTLDSDWSRFTEVDLNEARERLWRLPQVFAARLRVVGEVEWDRPGNGEWTLRAIAEHVSEPWYAEQVGDLSPTKQPSR